MPTSFTADVATGKMTEFRDYALQCARHFGACILLRDEPLSSEIPTFEPSQYHLNEAKKLEQQLSNFLAMDEEQRKELWRAEYCKALETRTRRLAEIATQRMRYEAMLQKAKAFKSPSRDHDNYAKFLVDQLQQSIEFDCDASFYEKPVDLVPFEEWQMDFVKGIERDLRQHRTGHLDELERTRSRNEWVEALKKALDNPSTGLEKTNGRN